MPNCSSFSALFFSVLTSRTRSVVADISSNLAFTTTNQDFQLERSLLEQGDGQFLSCYLLFLLSFVSITSCLCICSLKKKTKKRIRLFLVVLALRCCVRVFLVLVSGGCSSLGCTGFSLRRPLSLQSTGGRRSGFSRCSTQASAVVVHGL